MSQEIVKKSRKIDFSLLWKKEDWWAVWLGVILIVLTATGIITKVPRLPGWQTDIGAALPVELIPKLLLLGVGLAALTALAVRFMHDRQTVRQYLIAFPVVFLIAVLAYVIGNQTNLKNYGFTDVIWALALGMFVTNVFGKPKWLVPALRTELFIKTGLVVMGAEILLNRILTLGFYGLGVAWTVPPILLILMYQYGTKVLKMKDKSMVATISACASVCGVSAAIATGAATRAKKEEISMAVSVSLIFTVVMMIFQPLIVKWVGMSDAVGGAWIGGTVDSTGAVVVAGSMISQSAMEVAAVIKMLQNCLIGFVAVIFAAVIIAGDVQGEQVELQKRSKLGELWQRFPKFILGFLGASAFFSLVLVPALGQGQVELLVKQTGNFKNWLFTLAFVSIGLDTRFADMVRMYKGGKPVKLYVVGQTLNLILSLVAAYIFFSGRFFGLV